MEKPKKIKIFLVDDDALYLRLLEVEFLQQDNFVVETFATGELCIEHLSHNPDIIILDYHLDGIETTAMNGIEVLVKIKSLHPKVPVVMLSAQDKIEVAINCMHNKAYDYVVKSETAFMRLHKIIQRILEFKKIENELNWYMNRM
ncbi:MAG: response regulator [bacterium]|nr:response regulator [bacterium]